MKDIDFDELDQAVSSVLKTPAEANETSVDASASEKPKEEVAIETAEPVAAAPAPAEPEAPTAPKTPLAIKRRGQFMDVVHPSSDMTGKPGEVPAVPASKVSIQPISPSVEPEVPADAPAEVTEVALEAPADAEPIAPETPQAPAETADHAQSERTWPDPLDVMETQEETKDASTAAVAAVEDTAVETPPATEEGPVVGPEEESVSETPFLPDTKVDKRPLDAFSPEETPADVTTPGAVEAPAEPLPPELQPDVVAVEANPSDKPEEESAKETPAPAEKTSTPEPSFNASIPQQYVAEENKADEDHSIFDTREYHQPITPGKTKKGGFPGWLTAVLVILLLAGIGAAAGYFWFYYGL